MYKIFDILDILGIKMYKIYDILDILDIRMEQILRHHDV